MTTQRSQRSEAYAGICLIGATTGIVASVAGEALNQLALTLAGAAVVVVGISGAGLFVYRGSRQDQASITTSLGRALRTTIRLFLDT